MIGIGNGVVGTSQRVGEGFVLTLLRYVSHGRIVQRRFSPGFSQLVNRPWLCRHGV